VIGGVVAVGGCYDPRIRACTVTCAATAECGSGQTCEDGFCQRPGDACGVGPDAPEADAPGSDAPDIDAATGDAALDASDAPDGGGTTTWSKLSVGGYHACGITSASSLWCWGNNDYRQLGRTSPTRSGTPVRVDAGAATDGWQEVATGTRHSCGIRTDGQLWCWGFNEERQSGQTSGTYAAPSRVNDPGGLTGTRWTAVTAGVSFTCALRDDGTLWCFGTGDAGQLGQNVASTTSAAPLRVGTRADWRAIDAGYTHICGIYGPAAQRGHVACWGNNGGQDRIGDNGDVNRHVPTEVTDDGVIDWQRISAGDYASCALEATGQLWCWGSQYHVPLGAVSPIPTRYGTAVGIDAVSMGSFGGCLVDGGAPSCWGYNLEGELGFPPSNGTGTPELIAGVTAADVVGAGATFVCVHETGGTISCWGDRADGQLGDGVVGDPRAPVEVLGQHHPWQSVELGAEHTCGVTVAGATYCWGSNWGGQIGGGATLDAPFYETAVPVAVAGMSERITGGHAHGCALADSTRALSCWGNHDYGQRGVNAGSIYDPTSVDATPLTELATGRHSNCGVTAAGARRCWGHNDVSQLGNGDNQNLTVPTTITESANSWSELSMGDQYGCGLAAGTLHCWGHNNAGQAGQPTTTTIITTPMSIADPTPGVTDSWLDLSAGSGHACGLLGASGGTSGTIYCWGYNGRGQLGTQRADGPTLTSVPGATNFIDVAGGYGHTCGVRASGELHCWGSNDSGELGDGSLVPRTAIGASVGGMTDWLAVDAGTYVTCGIRTTDRRLFCWGDNRYGQTGTGGAVRWTAATVPPP
jgi:alpha-tubulin suppressor-like RCC1 family protein